MKPYLFGFAIAGALALASGAVAQDPAPPGPQTAPEPTAQEEAETVTVEGCLMRAEEVPGHDPGLLERAGILEGFVLTDAQIVDDSEAEGDVAEASAREEPAADPGAEGTRYEVTGLDSDELEQHAGRRVQIEGTIENGDQAPDRPDADPEAEPEAEDHPELEGIRISEAPSGECAAVQQ